MKDDIISVMNKTRLRYIIKQKMKKKCQNYAKTYMCREKKKESTLTRQICYHVVSRHWSLAPHRSFKSRTSTTRQNTQDQIYQIPCTEVIWILHKVHPTIYGKGTYYIRSDLEVIVASTVNQHETWTCRIGLQLRVVFYN